MHRETIPNPKNENARSASGCVTFRLDSDILGVQRLGSVFSCDISERIEGMFFVQHRRGLHGKASDARTDRSKTFTLLEKENGNWKQKQKLAAEQALNIIGLALSRHCGAGI
jgi:hypothetical protein